MRRLVVALAHSIVAQPDGQKQLVIEQGRPELYLALFLQPPSPIAALRYSTLNRLLEIDAPVLMAAGSPHHHAEAQPLPRPAAGRYRDATRQRGVDEGCIARQLARLLKTLLRACQGAQVAGQRKQVLGASHPQQRLRPIDRQQCHAVALRNTAPANFAGARDTRQRLAYRNTLQAGLGVSDNQIGGDFKTLFARTRVRAGLWRNLLSVPSPYPGRARGRGCPHRQNS